MSDKRPAIKVRVFKDRDNLSSLKNNETGLQFGTGSCNYGYQFEDSQLKALVNLLEKWLENKDGVREMKIRFDGEIDRW